MSAALSIPISPATLGCWLITQYQLHLSPRKGFRCAYGVLHGRDSCSRFGKRAVERLGLAGGLRLLRRRFELCRSAAHVLEYDRQRGRQDRRDRFHACVNGWDPGCSRADLGECAGELACDGCLELGLAGCHW